MVAKPNRLLLRIEAFSRECGGGVVVHKAARGYSLFSERTIQRAHRRADRSAAAHR